MKRAYRLALLVLCMVLATACAGQPAEPKGVSQEQYTDIEQGQDCDEVLAAFGDPMATSETDTGSFGTMNVYIWPAAEGRVGSQVSVVCDGNHTVMTKDRIIVD